MGRTRNTRPTSCLSPTKPRLPRHITYTSAHTQAVYLLLNPACLPRHITYTSAHTQAVYLLLNPACLRRHITYTSAHTHHPYQFPSARASALDHYLVSALRSNNKKKRNKQTDKQTSIEKRKNRKKDGRTRVTTDEERVLRGR